MILFLGVNDMAGNTILLGICFLILHEQNHFEIKYRLREKYRYT